MIKAQRDRTASRLLTGIVCSGLIHAGLVWWLWDTRLRASQDSADASIPVQLVELPSDSVDLPPALPTDVVQQPEVLNSSEPPASTEAPPQLPPGAPPGPPPPSSPIEAAPQISPLPQETPSPAQDLPESAPPEPTPSVQQTPDLPVVSDTTLPPPDLSNQRSVPDSSPEISPDSSSGSTAAPGSDTTPNVDTGPPPESPQPADPSPTEGASTELPEVGVTGQLSPATYQVSVELIPIRPASAPESPDQLPYPLETQRMFQPDPQTSVCLPNPESVKRLGDTVAIHARVEPDGRVIPLAIVANGETAADTAAGGSSTIDISAGHPYEQLAACLLGEWTFQPAQVNGTPVADNSLIVEVQLISVP